MASAGAERCAAFDFTAHNNPLLASRTFGRRNRSTLSRVEGIDAPTGNCHKIGMTWLRLSFSEWRRRPLRTAVCAAGVAIAVGAMFSRLSFQDGYREGMRSEIDRLGAHVLAVPKGCPYDAASIALHGANWPCYLKSSYLDEVRHTPGVATAAPQFMSALYDGDRVPTVYVGADEQILALKPGWKLQGRFPIRAGELLVGADAAKEHKWQIGQTIQLPGLVGKWGTIAAILKPTAAAEDSFIYS